jgi:hypothetical protein
MTVAGFWSRVKKTDTCWLWQAARNNQGYGYASIDSKLWRVHRFAYESLVGPIPSGLVLDHLCRVEHCVNPTHLEIVTTRENVLRGVGLTAGYARQTHCKHGHEFTVENIYLYRGKRHCIACQRQRQTPEKQRNQRRLRKEKSCA